MNRLLLIALLFTSASRAQWTVHQSPAMSLTGIYFSDSLNGWVGGNNGIFHTTNGGDDWTQQWLRRTGHMAGLNSRECWATGNRDSLLHTTDAGDTWLIVPIRNVLDSISALGRICFADSTHGWVVAVRGSSSWILRTNDAGATWSAFLIGLFKSYQLCTFVDTLTGWVAERYWANVARTTDGGFTWAVITFSRYGAYDIQFLTRNIGWISMQVGINDAVISKSTDGGHSWSYKFADKASLWFVDTLHGWFVQGYGNPEIVHTSDGGMTWTSQFLYATTVFIQSRIFFADRSHGWVIGEGGLMFRTRNGGITSTQAETDGIPSDFKLFQNYPNPFNPETCIHFELPQGSLVRLVVCDVLGREVATLVNEVRKAGSYDVPFAATSLASGVYFYHIQAGTFSDAKKLLVLR